MRFLLFASLALVPAAPLPAAAPPLLRTPQRCAVRDGRAWMVRLDEDDRLRAAHFALAGPADGREVQTRCRSSLLRGRWHLAQDALWLGYAWNGIGGFPRHPVSRLEISRLEAGELLKGRLVCGPGGPAAVQEDDEDPFTWGLPLGQYVPDPFLVHDVGILAAQADFRASIECDILPDGSSIRLLVLTNARGRVESSAPAPGGGTVAISAGIIRVTEEERTNPRWTLRVYRWDAKWDQKELEWKSKAGEWAAEGRIEARFREPFRAFQRGADFYFLTDYGSLYRAPANAKPGTSRKMHLVHDGKASPRHRLGQRCRHGALVPLRRPRGQGQARLLRVGPQARPRRVRPQGPTRGQGRGAA